MRLALDVTPVLGGPGGVRTFVTELLAALHRDPVPPTIIPYVLSARAGAGAVRTAVAGDRAVVRAPLPAAALRPLWRRTAHPVAERWLGEVDVVHGTNFVVPPARSAAEVVSVHDLSYVHERDVLHRDLVAFDRDVAAAVDRGATVHALSRFVAGEIRARHPGADVVVVELGVRLPARLGETPPATGRETPERATVLAVGRTEHRKQLDWLVRAFGLLAGDRPELRLVLAGPPGRAEAEVVAALEALPGAVAGRVDRVVAPTDAQRDELYGTATLFVHPARYEGFGLPLLEAMAHGVPVVAAASGAALEVAAGAARFVPLAGSDEELAGAIAELLDDPPAQLVLARRGAVRAEGFSWERTASEMLALYHRVAGRHR